MPRLRLAMTPPFRHCEYFEEMRGSLAQCKSGILKQIQNDKGKELDSREQKQNDKKERNDRIKKAVRLHPTTPS